MLLRRIPRLDDQDAALTEMRSHVRHRAAEVLDRHHLRNGREQARHRVELMLEREVAHVAEVKRHARQPGAGALEHRRGEIDALDLVPTP
jgi:hypothetical protein